MCYIGEFCGSCAHRVACAVSVRPIMLHCKFEMPDSATGAESCSKDWDPRRDLAVMDGDALNVSVMSLGGEVLVTVMVPRRNSIWELKGLIEKSIPG